MTRLQTDLALTAYFIAWKTLILVIAFASPGQGYDTSTTLLTGTNKLVRWDAIYYVQKAQRGDIYEQEWAFGKGLSTLLGLISGPDLQSIAIAGIVLSHVTHYGSVILVRRIADLITIGAKDDGYVRHVPFIAACLHIIAPAGIFLSAPYAEAPFACLNMLGYYLYLSAYSDRSRSKMQRYAFITAAGLSIGLATVIRSNGVLSGIPFLLDALWLSRDVGSALLRGKFRLCRFMLLVSTVAGGLLIAAGLIGPQYLAYLEYCSGPDARPWCHGRTPLIYSFVQTHYWGVGFLRYWTISNLPLFVLAAPSLFLLIWSGADGLWLDQTDSSKTGLIALPQLILAILAITNYHVQIITRLASGYPWVYIWMARRICSRPEGVLWQTRFAILYGLIQAGLFASFLPPA